MFASRALEIFKEKGTEILLVIDEFGGLQGLLTINDIIEEIVGQIELEEPQATQRQDGSWLLDGMLEVDEFKEIFNLTGLPHEEEYETLSGFVMVSLGRVPQTADHFEWHGLRFEIYIWTAARWKVPCNTLPPGHAATTQNSKNTNIGLKRSYSKGYFTAINPLLNRFLFRALLYFRPSAIFVSRLLFNPIL